MKGVVFTEFSEMVESEFGLEVLDSVLEQATESGGVYTAVGTYDHAELVSMVGKLSAETDVPVPDLVRAFGRYLFGRFRLLYPELFTSTDDPFVFLESVESTIHVEVRKLYPDAECPRIACEREAENTLIVEYDSPRGFPDLAHGLIEACLSAFGQDHATIERTDADPATGTKARFRITR